MKVTLTRHSMRKFTLDALGDVSQDYFLFQDSISSYGRTKESVSSILDIEYKLKGQLNDQDNFWNVINSNYESQNTLVEKTLFQMDIKLSNME